MPTRDHTERMLQGFGYECERSERRVCVRGGGRLAGTDIDIPADISSAAFYLVAATIAADSTLTLPYVGVNPTRTGVLEILRQMGARIDIQNQREVCGEPVADIVVQSDPFAGNRRSD